MLRTEGRSLESCLCQGLSLATHRGTGSRIPPLPRAEFGYAPRDGVSNPASAKGWVWLRTEGRGLESRLCQGLSLATHRGTESRIPPLPRAEFGYAPRDGVSNPASAKGWVWLRTEGRGLESRLCQGLSLATHRGTGSRIPPLPRAEFGYAPRDGGLESRLCQGLSLATHRGTGSRIPPLPRAEFGYAPRDGVSNPASAKGWVWLRTEGRGLESRLCQGLSLATHRGTGSRIPPLPRAEFGYAPRDGVSNPASAKGWVWLRTEGRGLESRLCQGLSLATHRGTGSRIPPLPRAEFGYAPRDGVSNPASAKGWVWLRTEGRGLESRLCQGLSLATHRGTGSRIPPLPRAEFGRLTLERHNWLVTPREGGGL